MLKTIKTNRLRLNQSGVAHLLYPILGVVVVAVIAGAGFFVYQQNKSGAAKKTTGTIKINAGKLLNGCIYLENPEYWSCSGSEARPRADKTTHVFVIGASPGATCQKINVHNGRDLGRNRKLQCTPGTYEVALDYPAEIRYRKNKNSKEVHYSKSRIVNVSIGKTNSINLGVDPQ